MEPVGSDSGDLVFVNLVTHCLNQAQEVPQRSRGLKPPAARTSSVSLAAKSKEPIGRQLLLSCRI